MGLLDQYFDPATLEAAKQFGQPSEEERRQARNNALMNAGFAMMMNNQGRSKSDALFNALGAGGMAGTQSYQGQLEEARQRNQQQFQMAGALQKLQQEAAQRKAQQDYLQNTPDVPPEVRAGVVPFTDWWKRQNPEDQYKTVGDSLVRVTPSGATSVFQNKKLPEGMEIGPDGNLRFIPAYLAGKKEIARSGASSTNVNVDNLGLKPKDRFEMEDKLRNDYSKATDLDSKVMGVAAKMRSVLSGDPNAMKDQATIYSFAKMLDPDGAVRESDYAAIMNTAGLSDRIKNYVSKMATGQVLSDKQRKEMAGIIDDWERVAKKRIGDQQNTFASRAKMYNLHPENVYQPLQSDAAPASGSKQVVLDDGSKVIAQRGSDGNYYVTQGGKKYRVEE